MNKILFLIMVFSMSTTSLWAGNLDGFNKIARINELKKEASKAFQNQDYETAKTLYLTLKDSFAVSDDRVLLNLANSHFHTDQKVEADKIYTDLLASENKEIRSRASLQKGVIQFEKKELSKALISFKNALKNNPANEEARYNYELVKKLLEQNKDQDQQDKDQQKQDQDQKEDKEDSEDQKSEADKNQGDPDDNDQEGKEGEDSQNQDKSKEGDQSKSDKKDQERQEQERGDKDEKDKKNKDSEGSEAQGQEGDQDENRKLNEDQLRQMLQEMEMTEETAKSILDAMRNSEVQYIQQMRRKSTKKPDSGKPDW
jgi:Ca-activated chloride channel homolog